VIEILVVDDGSTDRTVTVAHERRWVGSGRTRLRTACSPSTPILAAAGAARHGRGVLDSLFHRAADDRRRDGRQPGTKEYRRRVVAASQAEERLETDPAAGLADLRELGVDYVYVGRMGDFSGPGLDAGG